MKDLLTIIITLITNGEDSKDLSKIINLNIKLHNTIDAIDKCNRVSLKFLYYNIKKNRIENKINRISNGYW